MNTNFFWQGHRGERGLYPENTLLGFANCLKNGVRAVELDVLLCADGQVVVSHEPYFSPEYCLTPEGKPIESEAIWQYNFFNMTYSEICAFDCGSLPHPRFPMQKNARAYKPLLLEVIAHLEALSDSYTPPFYTIEIKVSEEWVEKGQPSLEYTAGRVLETIYQARLSKQRFCIESFEPQVLEHIRRKDGDIKIGLLVENSLSVEENLRRLSFAPDMYAAHQDRIHKAMIDELHQKNIRIWAWTVNNPQTAQRLLDWGVDSIITDFPSQMKEEFAKQPTH
jgi:glycerophosphoryl diester phosphodiesterase